MLTLAYSSALIVSPPWEELRETLIDDCGAFPDYCEVQVYGRSTDGRPLLALKLSKHSKILGQRKVVLITESTHGNEYLNIVPRLARAFAEKAREQGPVQGFLQGGGIILLVPVVNPDGYAHISRKNANGVDLNRDFEDLRELETRALIGLLDREGSGDQRKLVLSVDYHCCGPGLILPFGPDPVASPEILREYDFMINAFRGTFDNRRTDTTLKVLGYAVKGGSTDAFIKRYGSKSAILEGFRGEDDLFRHHVLFWEMILAHCSTHNNACD